MLQKEKLDMDWVNYLLSRPPSVHEFMNQERFALAVWSTDTFLANLVQGTYVLHKIAHGERLRDEFSLRFVIPNRFAHIWCPF